MTAKPSAPTADVRKKLLSRIAAAQRQADTAKKAAKLAKLGFRHAKDKFKAAKRAAKKLRKAVKSLKAELVALGTKKGARKRPAARPVVKRSRPAAVAALEPSPVGLPPEIPPLPATPPV